MTPKQPRKKQVKRIKEKILDLKCDCGCGQRVHFMLVCWNNGIVLDVGHMKPGERRPKVGIVITNDYKKLLKFLPHLKVK